jgi:hypothetical protein
MNICYNCNDKINIKTNLSKFKTKYATKEDFEERVFNFNDFTFFFRNRLFEDNITSGIINFENQEEDINGLINFLMPQCTKIKYQDKEYDNLFLKDAFLEIGLNNVIKILDELKSESWGIDSFFLYECKKCNAENKAYLSDPYRSSYYSIPEKDLKSNLELLEIIIQISSFKILSYSELLSIPINLWEPTVKYINDVIKKKYSGKNSAGYLENFQEEFQ